jgi:chromosome segregation ATPase
MFRNVTRWAVLRVPRIRRFYEHSQNLLQHNLALHQHNLALQEDITKLRAAKEEAAKELETLRLDLYVLRSDFQRSVNQNEDLRIKLRAAERELEQTRERAETVERQLAETRAQIGNSDTLRDEFRTIEIHLFERMETVSAEIKALRQLIGKKTRDDPNSVAEL